MVGFLIQMPNTLRLGLTGGIGSGKSTVAAMFAEFGAHVIDADSISRATTAVDGLAMPCIAAEFGSQYIRQDHSLDREAMRALAFRDSSARKRLEAIIHPLVDKEISYQTEIALQKVCPCIIFDIPLLAESSNWRKRVNQVMVVDCLVDIQISRVVARNGIKPSEVENMIASQAPRASRLKAADLVVFNGAGSIGELQIQIDQIWQGFGLSSANLLTTPH